MIDATVFQALLNRVETLEMGQDKAIVQIGNLRIENLEMKSNLNKNVQKVQNYQYTLDDLSKETQILQYKVTGLALNLSKTIWRFELWLQK